VIAALAIAAAGIAVLAALLAPPVLRRRRREENVARGLPPGLGEMADRGLAIRSRLPQELRARHDGLIAAFIAEKEFVGCNGFEVTDAVRVTIAAHACLLLIGRPAGLYDELFSILVYPAAFWVEDEVHDDDGLVTRRRRMLSGEAWDSRRIILSWQDIEESAALPPDGFNVVLHEFAHYLEAEGSSLADPRRDIDSWTLEIADEFTQFIHAVERGEDTLLDPYGAEDETEFFAVATEEFYERPAALRDGHPRLYGLLREFYGVDPAGWVTRPS
jgi:Mlc titration factor MtfA (ptsG expression regulator)